MKLQVLSCGVGIFAAIASVTDARAKFHDKVHVTNKIVPGAYIAEFEEGVGSSLSFFAHFNRKSTPDITVRHNFQSDHIKGVSFSVKGDHSLSSILEAPGIKNIWPVTFIPGLKPMKGTQKRDLKKASKAATDSNFDVMHNLTGVGEVHQKLKNFGKGIKVGVIDSGVYYKHPAFGVNGKPGCYKGPGCRVQYGYDLVGDDYSSDNLVAIPDNDPLDDCSEESHGTHVAGIIGADASKIKGNLEPAFPFYGVAPQVTLGAYRVFGCKVDGTTNEVIGKAILIAAKDGMDVINLSIGGGPAWHEDFQNTIINRVSAAGHIVVSAMGNDGFNGLWAGSNPGLAEGGFGVASVDSQNLLMNTINDDSGNAYSYMPAYEDLIPFDNFKAKIIVNNPKANLQKSTNDGCKPLKYKADGAVVIFRMPSECKSIVSCHNALAAGAVGCLIYGREPGSFGILGDSKIPSASLTFSTGMAIIARVNTKPATIFSFTDKQRLFTSDSAGAPSIFSSWAIDPELQIKPNIAAIGGDVYSTLSPKASGGVGYGTYSGTSMSTPYLAGSIALYMSYKGKANFKTLKTRLQNSAHPSHSFGNSWYASVAQQGAGVVNVFDTILSTTVVTPSELALNDTVNMMKSYKIVIKNEHSTAIRYAIEHQPAATVYSKDVSSDMLLDIPIEASEYASALFSKKSVKIAAGKSKTITVNFKAPETSNPNRIPIFSGYITVKPKLLGAPSSRVTYAGLKGSWKAAPIFSKKSALGSVVTGIYYQDQTPIKTGDVINLTRSIFSKIVLATPTRLYYAEAFKASSAKGKKERSLGYLFESLLGPLYREYSGRNTETQGQSTSTSSSYRWNGLVTNSKFGTTNSTLPPGQYKIRISGLRHFGDPNNSSDFDVYESPVFKITY